jgi:hypothetical protein
MAASVTMRTLRGFKYYDLNVFTYENIISDMKAKIVKAKNIIEDPKSWGRGKMRPFKEKMKFTTIIGNPPYQEVVKDNNLQSPVYYLFIDLVREMSRLSSLIHPGRFLFMAGRTPNAWNTKILDDANFHIIRSFANSSDLFPNVDIMGGIAISLYDLSRDFGPIKLFIREGTLKSILHKVLAKNEGSLSTIIYTCASYRYNDAFQNEQFGDLSESEFRIRMKNRFLFTGMFEWFPKCFFVNKPDDGEEYVEIYGRLDNKRVFRWFKRRYLIVPDNFEKFKVILPSSNGSGAIGEGLSTSIIGMPLICTPLMGHTATYISIGAFDSESQANALLKYIKSKFARAMLGTRKVTQDNKAKETWQNVPIQDFTSMSDIDWDKSVREIDQQLYAKYGLSDAEIEFIESNVKSMD